MAHTHNLGTQDTQEGGKLESGLGYRVMPSQLKQERKGPHHVMEALEQVEVWRCVLLPKERSRLTLVM